MDTLTRSLSDVTSDFRFTMLVTGTTARPLTLQETEGDTIRFLVDAEADWVPQADGSTVLLAFADPKGNAYASVTGSGRVLDDRQLIARLYTAEADTFFESKDDPRIRVLEVDAQSGEWWDGPSGRVGMALAMVAAKATGDESKVGDSGSIDLR